MGYKCNVKGLQLDDSSAEELVYCGFLKEKKVCMNCENSEYKGIMGVNYSNLAIGNEINSN